MPVNSPRKDYSARFAQWQRCRDCYDGSDAVKARRTDYLPMLASHPANVDRYDEYRLRALFYNAMARTVDGLSGSIFQREPKWSGVTDVVSEQFKDVSLRGQPLEIFLLDGTKEVLKVGRWGMLVDMSKDASGTTPQPYWLDYKAEEIIDWRVDRSTGDERLVQVRLMETYEEVDSKDQWVELERKQVRVLSLEDNRYVVRIFRRKNEDSGDWYQEDELVPERKGKPLPFIPFVCVGPTSISLDIEKPPLLDLADVNLSHYRTMADLEHGRHYVALPTPWVSGILGQQSGPLRMGAGEAWVLNENGSAGMLEFSGKGLEALVTADRDKRKLMATLGAKLLEEQPSGSETATAVGMRHSGEHASLRTIAQAMEQAATQAAQYHAWWLGTEATPRETEAAVELNKEFFSVKATPQEITAALQMLQAEEISYATFYNILIEGGWAREGVDAEEEREEIEADTEYRGESRAMLEHEDKGEETVVPPQGEVVAEGNPYRVEKRANKWVVVKKDDGKVVGTHGSREGALAQLRALEANVGHG